MATIRTRRHVTHTPHAKALLTTTQLTLTSSDFPPSSSDVLSALALTRARRCCKERKGLTKMRLSGDGGAGVETAAASSMAFFSTSAPVGRAQ
jgi:hypothetical protein